VVNIKVTVLSDVTSRMWAQTLRENVAASSFGQIGSNIRDESVASVRECSGGGGDVLV
jgi:hypothetical protein